MACAYRSRIDGRQRSVFCRPGFFCACRNNEMFPTQLRREAEGVAQAIFKTIRCLAIKLKIGEPAIFYRGQCDNFRWRYVS